MRSSSIWGLHDDDAGENVDDLYTVQHTLTTSQITTGVAFSVKLSLVDVALVLHAFTLLFTSNTHNKHFLKPPKTAEAMKFAIVSVLASLLVAGTSAQGFSCAGVDMIRCDNAYGNAGPQVCASDGRTYTNKCYFLKADCDNKGMRVLHNGMCRRDEGIQP